MATAAFLRDARSLGLPYAERLAIVTWIAANPAAGDVIEGTGGARKVGFAGKGKGKSGGYRVITFFSGILKSVLAEMVATYRSGKESR